MHGFTGVAREYRRQGVATALKLRAIEYAREHGYQTIRAFNLPIHSEMLALNEKLGFPRRFCYVTVEKCLKEVVKVAPQIYDAYVGQYAPDPDLLRQHGKPLDLVATIKKVGDQLITEVGEMQDKLFPESETQFFIKEHYGHMTFVKDKQGQVTHLVYREPGLEVLANKIK